MSKLNWRKAELAPKRSMSIRDEAEYRDRDAAARWLERKSHFKALAAKKRAKAKKGRAA